MHYHGKKCALEFNSKYYGFELWNKIENVNLQARDNDGHKLKKKDRVGHEMENCTKMKIAQNWKMVKNAKWTKLKVGQNGKLGTK